jgi:hypothetical protein
LRLLRNAVGELQRNGQITVPEEYESLVGTRDIPSFFHLVVAYAISVSIRGCSYAYGLAQLPAKPIYRHHWMRSPALRHALVESTVVEAKTTEWIPWGPVLRKIFDPTVPKRPSPVDLERVLVEWRRITPELRDALTKTREKPNAKGITEDEELLIQALLDVGIAPRYADTRGAESLPAGCVISLDYIPQSSKFLSNWSRHHFRRASFAKQRRASGWHSGATLFARSWRTQALKRRCVGGNSRPNFGVKLARPGFGPAAELPRSSPACRRHAGCSSPLAAMQFIGGNRRAAQGFGTRDRPCSLHQGR